MDTTPSPAERPPPRALLDALELDVVLHALPDAIVVVDRDCRLQFVNPRARAIFVAIGRDPSALIGQPLTDHLPPPLAARLEEERRTAIAESQVATFEMAGIRDGTWVEVRIVPGTDGGAIVFARDMTAQRTADTAATELAAALERSHFLADAGAALASSLDLDVTLERVARLALPFLADYCIVDILDAPDDARRVAMAHVDPALEAMLHGVGLGPLMRSRSLAARVLRTGESVLLPEISDAMLASAASGDAAVAAVYATLRPRSAIAVPMVVRGTILGAIQLASSREGRRYGPRDLETAQDLARRAASAVDNARLHAAEQAARAEAEDSNRAKAEFLTRMSHELRTPLNAIAGYAQLIEIEIHGPVTAEQREALSRIQRSQRHLLGLINDILNFAKLEAGHVEYRIEAIALRGVLASVEGFVTPQLGEKAITFTHAECEPALVVRADAEKVKQVLLNLLSNAVKFTPAGGAIAVTCDADASDVYIRVRDTGIGIAPGQLEQIFEPFVQLDRSLASAREGTGLGLAISRDLARGMGGDLVAESAAGAGSTFTLRLPRAVGSRP